MKLKPIASNMTELHLNNGMIVLFSYETPVAAIVGTDNFGTYIVTKTKYSKTTSKHINSWATGKQELVDQEVLDNLVNESKVT